MVDPVLTSAMKNYLASVEAHVHVEGDAKVHKCFFSKSYNSGCDMHPDLQEHKLITEELADFIRGVVGW